jgi:hypothetical protein
MRASNTHQCLLNVCSEFSSGSGGTFDWIRCLILTQTEEDIMRRLCFVIAALGAIAVAAPSIASAETVVIKRGGYHHGYGARAEMHRGYGWHRGWGHHHRDRVVVIKKRYHRY